MLRVAFKEWALICQELSEGRQAIILRKGGVAEEGGVFKPEFARFWLYPTFVHQQEEGIKRPRDYRLGAQMRDRPSAGMISLKQYVKVTGTFFIRHLDEALSIDRLHGWSEETVRKRFAYRDPGIFVLAVRVYKMPVAHEIPLLPRYDGCKSWVELEKELPTEEAAPVLDDRQYANVLNELDRLLNTALFAGSGAHRDAAANR